MDPFLLPVHNVQEMSEGHRGLGEQEEREGQPRDGGGVELGYRPWAPVRLATGETEAVTGLVGGGGWVGPLVYCKAEQGKPEDVQNKRTDHFPASEVAGTETAGKKAGCGFGSGLIVWARRQKAAI